MGTGRRRACRPAAAPVRPEALAGRHPSQPTKTRASSPSPVHPLPSAYAQTDTTQLLVTILWAGRIDAFSRRVLADAMRAAADEGRPIRLNVFAAAACKLFQHTLQTLARRAGYATWAGMSDDAMAEADAGAEPWCDELNAAIDELGKAAHVGPRVIVTDGAGADRFVTEALSALQGIFASVGRYLEQVLQALDTPMGRGVANAFILEARRELDELAVCHAVGEVYVESLTITEPGDKSVSLEVEGSLGATSL